MKRYLKAACLVLALALVLTIPAMAAEISGSTTSGSMSWVEHENGAAAELKVNGTDLTGDYYLVLMVKEDSSETVAPTPTEDNIVYIDQATAADGKVSFTVLPSRLENDSRYHIHLIGSDRAYGEASLIKTVSFPLEFTPGDVDGDGKVTANDALFALQISAEFTSLKIGNADTQVTELMRLAADVDGTPGVTAGDVLVILKMSVGMSLDEILATGGDGNG